jgi:hypothetical protein
MVSLLSGANWWKRRAAAGYALDGEWHAESTTVAGVPLPVGPRLVFAPAEVVIAGEHLPVRAYVRDGHRVHVMLGRASAVDMTVTLEFEERDRIVWEGFGIRAAYRRVPVAGTESRTGGASNWTTSRPAN